MAEVPRQLTQAEIDRILFNQRLGIQPTPPSIQNLQQRTSGTVTPIPQNLFQRMAGGASAAGQFVNQAGTAADIAKLFPGYTGQSQVNIPTGFNFAPKQAPTGEVIPGGLQTNQINVNQLLSAIKPADVLGLTGAQQAYTDVGMGKAPKPMDVLDIAGLGAVGYGAGKGLLKAGKNAPVGMSIQDAPGLLQTAPKSDIGFYSAVEQAAMASPRKQGAGQAFLNDISKGQDVRADEIKWLGLDDYLKGKQNVTKQEVQDYIANNRVNVQEVRSTIPRLPGEGMPGDQGAFLPKFASYTLPGGENYRELLLTMPNKSVTQATERAAELKNKYDGYQRRMLDIRSMYPGLANRPPEIQSEFENLLKISSDTANEMRNIRQASSAEAYKSSHFPETPNILAHLRVNDRVDADGKKMLLIEEVQSDWHQAGRDKGYASEAKPSTFVLKNPETGGTVGNFATKEEAAEFMRTSPRAQEFAQKQFVIDEISGKRSGVPDAPFKDTWYQLALKRAIQHAAENGYDRIGLTTGSQQAARFDLSKQVSELSYRKMDDPLTMSLGDGVYYEVTALDNSGNQAIKKQVTAKELPDVVGKEMAEKIIKGEGSSSESGKSKYFRGLDLQVGGEGMKKYYDEIYPKFLDKYGKKWGARIGETKVDADGMQEPIRYLDVTPEMRAGVSKGQPLFQAAPIVGTGLLGSQQDERR
jgi:hypothetical protein